MELNLLFCIRIGQKVLRSTFIQERNQNGANIDVFFNFYLKHSQGSLLFGQRFALAKNCCIS